MEITFFIILVLAAICCIIAAVVLVAAVSTLAKGLMGFLRHLYGDEHNTENHTEHSRGQEGDLPADSPDTVRRRSAGRGGSRSLPGGG